MKEEICGVVCNCGPFKEPIACGFPPHEEGNHSWATLPTFIEKDNGTVEVVWFKTVG